MIDSVPYIIARISEDRDFFKLREMAENHDGWSLDYDKTNVKVWTKQVDNSSFNMVKVLVSYDTDTYRFEMSVYLHNRMKVWAIFSNISCVDLYDTIQDPEYRKEWDSHMIVGIDIGYLNPNNDISYYAMYCPTPLKNRDLVLQKSWLDAGTEFYIINHSVCHKDYPPKKGFVRAVSYFTGYFIKCQALNREGIGCELSYVTRSDPQGDLPSWLVNKCTQILAPRYVKQIEKAASRYGAWKSNNNPLIKPWVYPEQIKSPRLTVQDCVPCQEELELNPFLKKINFDFYLTPVPGETSSCLRALNSREDAGKKEELILNEENIEKEEMRSRPSSSSSTSQHSNPRKAKNRLNSLLKFTKICKKKSKDLN